MHKKICIIYTETTGLHQSNYISKKELFKFARMVTLNYEIGYLKGNEFIIENKVRSLVKPRCMYIPKETEQYHGITMEMAKEQGTNPDVLLKQFKDDIKNIDVIVSHNIDFHLKTILTEAILYNIQLDFTKYIIIDTINFFHNYSDNCFIKLRDLATKLKFKDIPESSENNVEIIRDVFLKLYKKFEKSVNSEKELTV